MPGRDVASRRSPTSGALLGSLQFAIDHQIQNPQENVAAVLITDGDPTLCETLISAIAAIADAAYNGVAEIETFTVALPGATVTDLDSIAASGGTMASYDLTGGVTTLDATLAEIRSRVEGCRFDVSDVPVFDPALSSVVYHPGDGGPPLVLPPVASELECGSSVAWYADDVLMPGEVFLCPEACSLVAADADSRLVS